MVLRRTARRRPRRITSVCDRGSLDSAVMDLHVIGPLASPAERAAVDAVLGPPESGWVGGPRDSGTDGHASRGGHATRSRRSQLLPALHAVQSRIGWISTPALNYICKRLAVAPAEAYGVATFYALFATSPRPPIVAHVCDDIACRLAGAEALCGDLTRAVGPAGEPARDGRVTWLRSPCLGLCDRAPAALFTFAGETPSTFAHAPVDAVGVVTMLEADQRARSIHLPRPSPGRPRADSPPRPGRRRRPDLARRLPRPRRLRGPDPRARDRPGGRHRRGHRLQAHGPRRRRLPDRPQVGRGRRPSPPSRTTSSATPTNPSPARSRTASSSRATRSRRSRR